MTVTLVRRRLLMVIILMAVRLGPESALHAVLPFGCKELEESQACKVLAAFYWQCPGKLDSHLSIITTAVT